MAYGKYKTSQIKGQAGTNWQVEIWKKGFNVIPSVGDEVGGGVVFHVSSTKIYVVAKEDISDGGTTTFDWGCMGTDISSAEGTAVGTGQANTAQIVAACSSTDIAAYMCSNLTLNTYSDWFLPSTGELALVYDNKSTLESVAGFSAFGSNNYWTSTQSNSNSANVTFFFNGNQPAYNKNQSYKVRPIRSYTYTPITEFTPQGEGFEIKWTGQGGTRDREFLASECVLSLFAENDSDEAFIYDVFEKGDKEYFIRIYKNSVSNANIWWFGWVQPSFDVLSNEPYPYPVKIIATDSIGVYKERGKDVLTPSDWAAADRINNHINDFGTTMSLYNLSPGSVASGDLAPAPYQHKWFKTSVDWWRDGDTYQSNDPFYLYYITSAAYRKDAEKKPYNYKKYDVLKGCMKTFNTVGFLSDGHYNFIQPNNLAGSLTGDVRMYPYLGSDNEVPSSGVGDVTTLLEIDQTQNANKGTVLAGANITFEPLFKSVTVDFINGNTSFNVPNGVDLTSPFTAGQLQAADADIGSLGLSFSALHFETFSFTPATGRTLENWAIRTIGTLKIKHGTGSSSRWLKEFGLGFVWETTEQSITLKRGRNIGNANGGPNSGGTYGMTTSSSLSNTVEDPDDEYPCNIEYNSSTGQYTARTRINFQTFSGIPIPQVSGDITIELNCSNDYWQFDDDAGTPYITATPSGSITKVTEANGISMIAYDTQALDGQVGLTYTTAQDANEAYEDYDLGEITTGCTTAGGTNFSNLIFSVKYNSGSNLLVASQGFRRANSGSFLNISQLLTQEFLELQTEPLEILQADIFSPDISPLKYIKYSINNDGSYKYYQFLGGTFKAQSETMSGEWFKLSSGTVITPDPPDEIYQQEFRPVFQELGKSIRSNSGLIGDDKSNNAYGSLASDLPENTADTKVTLASASKGKIYDGQKLLLCYPDGSNPLTLTASGDSTTSDTQIDLSSFTPDKDYPAGSLLVPLTYDLTNVITGGGGGGTPGGSDTQVQFNDGGSFGGDSGLTYNKSTDTLTTTNIVAQDLDITGSSNALTINSTTGNVAINASSTDADCIIRVADNSTAGTNVIGFVATGDDSVIRNDEGNLKVKMDNNSDVTLNLDQSGNLRITGYYQGTNTGYKTFWNTTDSLLYYYLNPSDFNLSSNSSVNIYSRDKGGSVVSSAYDSRADDTMAFVNLPVGYKIKDLIVYSNVNITFVLEYGSYNDDTVTSIQSGGTTNSALILSSAETIDERRYYIIRVEYTATTDEIWGGRITLEKV
jgi:hypothetical protein